MDTSHPTRPATDRTLAEVIRKALQDGLSKNAIYGKLMGMHGCTFATAVRAVKAFNDAARVEMSCGATAAASYAAAVDALAEIGRETMDPRVQLSVALERARLASKRLKALEEAEANVELVKVRLMLAAASIANARTRLEERRTAGHATTITVLSSPSEHALSTDISRFSPTPVGDLLIEEDTR